MPLQSLLFVSRNADYVDCSGNPKALFQRLDFLQEGLPPWLRPIGYNTDKHRRQYHVTNPENESVIDGEAATRDVAAGDRRTAILIDEFARGFEISGRRVLASTRDATNCRVFNSTHIGIHTAFYEQSQKPEIKKLRLHWSVHPKKNIGLYTTNKDGTLKILNEDGYPKSYKPLLDGKLRSPWYDYQCQRSGSEREIAEELDINPHGAGGQFFSHDKIYEAINKYARPPIAVGSLLHDRTTGDPKEFREFVEGSLGLWCLLNREGIPNVDNDVIIAADVAAGTGASNSCLVGYDQIKCEKVFEYASPYIRPEAFGTLAVAVCKWFKKGSGKYPLLIWERNGPGRQFGGRVIDLGYNNVYFRKRNEGSRSSLLTDIPGWPTTKESKLVLLGDYRAAIEAQELINYSRKALEETLEYVFAPNGGVVHARADDKTDPSGANANHGDRVIADALARKGIEERRVVAKTEPPEIPIGSLAWRNKMWKKTMDRLDRELGAEWHR